VLADLPAPAARRGACCAFSMPPPLTLHRGLGVSQGLSGRRRDGGSGPPLAAARRRWLPRHRHLPRARRLRASAVTMLRRERPWTWRAPGARADQPSAMLRRGRRTRPDARAAARRAAAATAGVGASSGPARSAAGCGGQPALRLELSRGWPRGILTVPDPANFRGLGTQFARPLSGFAFFHAHSGSHPWAFSTAVCHARFTSLMCPPVSSPKTNASGPKGSPSVSL